MDVYEERIGAYNYRYVLAKIVKVWDAYANLYSTPDTAPVHVGRFLSLIEARNYAHKRERKTA
jgi:hypothetical protein